MHFFVTPFRERCTGQHAYSTSHLLTPTVGGHHAESAAGFVLFNSHNYHYPHFKEEGVEHQDTKSLLSSEAKPEFRHRFAASDPLFLSMTFINKMKRQPSEWEKIFAKEFTDKGLISKIYKQLMQLNIKKKRQPNQKVGRPPK